jgi:hypothetical protein
VSAAPIVVSAALVSGASPPVVVASACPVAVEASPSPSAPPAGSTAHAIAISSPAPLHGGVFVRSRIPTSREPALAARSVPAAAREFLGTRMRMLTVHARGILSRIAEALAIALLASTLASVDDARAEPAPPPARCPSAFVADVGELGVMQVRIGERAPREVTVDIEGEVDGKPVRRSFTARTCATAHRVADIVVASVREAVGRAPPRPRAPAPEPDAIVPPPPETVEPAIPAPTVPAATIPSGTPMSMPTDAVGETVRPSAEPRTRTIARREPIALRFALGPEGGLAFGVLPRITGTVGLRAALLVGRWRAELAGAWLTRQREDASDGGAARLQLWSVEARGAFVPRVRIVEFPIHVGIVVGDLIARGIDVVDARTSHAFWAAAMAGAGVGVVPIPRVAVVADASALAAFSRPTFTFGRGADEPFVVHRPPVFGVRALLRVEIRLP